jgi:hypothetical protein
MRKRRRDSSAIDFRYASSADILVSSTDVHYTSETGGRSANWVRFVIRAWRSTTSRRSCSAVLIYSIPRAAKAFFGLLNASAEFSRQRDVCFGSKADMTAAVSAIPPNADIRQPMRLPPRLHPSQMLESYPRGPFFGKSAQTGGVALGFAPWTGPTRHNNRGRRGYDDTANLTVVNRASRRRSKATGE